MGLGVGSGGGTGNRSEEMKVRLVLVEDALGSVADTVCRG